MATPSCEIIRVSGLCEREAKVDFEYNAKTLEHKEKLESFMEQNVYPAEQEHHAFVEDPANMWQQPPVVEELKAKAQEAGIWNWFLPAEYAEWSPGFTNLEFAPLAELWVGFLGRLRCLTARLRTGAIWKYSRNTGPRNNKTSGFVH